MFVKSLELKNFRNYYDLSITFDKDNNILFGNNAQGKTNTLEAIYVCGTTKSHKGCKDKELIKIGENESHIRIIVNNNKAKYIISNSIINNTLLFNKVYKRRNTKNKINVIRGIMPNIISITDPLFIGLDISL